jgi:hypothetical protein
MPIANPTRKPADNLTAAASAFAAIAVDPNATAEDRRKSRTMLAAMGAVETPAPRIVRVEVPAKQTPAQIAANTLAEHPELRREFLKAQRNAESEARLTPRERELLAKLDGPSKEPARAYTRGTTHFTPFVTPAQARAMLAEMDLAGAHDDAREEEERGRKSLPAPPAKRPLIEPGGADYEKQLEELNERFGVK